MRSRERSKGLQYLTFRLAGRIRGLETRRIVRVAEIHHLSPLPSDLRCNLGLVVHRGIVAGLMDLERLEAQSSSFRDPPEKAPLTAPFHCIFARFPRGVAGFPIDELLDLKTVSAQDADRPSSTEFEAVDLDSLEIFI